MKLFEFTNRIRVNEAPKRPIEDWVELTAMAAEQDEEELMTIVMNSDEDTSLFMYARDKAREIGVPKEIIDDVARNAANIIKIPDPAHFQHLKPAEPEEEDWLEDPELEEGKSRNKNIKTNLPGLRRGWVASQGKEKQDNEIKISNLLAKLGLKGGFQYGLKTAADGNIIVQLYGDRVTPEQVIAAKEALTSLSEAIVPWKDAHPGEEIRWLDDETGELLTDKEKEEMDNPSPRKGYELKGNELEPKHFAMFGDIAAGGGDPIDYLITTYGYDIEDLDAAARENGYDNAYEWAESFREIHEDLDRLSDGTRVKSKLGNYSAGKEGVIAGQDETAIHGPRYRIEWDDGSWQYMRPHQFNIIKKVGEASSPMPVKDMLRVGYPDVKPGDQIRTRKMAMSGIVEKVEPYKLWNTDAVYFRTEDGKLMRTPLSNVTIDNR